MANIYDRFDTHSAQCPCKTNHKLKLGSICSMCQNKGFIIPHKDRHIYIIGAMAKNRVIGKNNKLPWHIPDDLRYFKQITKHKPVIMGRKTYESIGRPLPDRRNIVLTRTKTIPNVLVKPSLEEAIFSCHPNEQIMIIGGAEIYSAALPYARRIYLTIIDEEYDGDTYFPQFEDEWKKIDEVMHIEKEPWFSFNTYERK